MSKLHQIIENKLFCGMFGLAVMLSFPTRSTSKNIDKMLEFRAISFVSFVVLVLPEMI